MDPLDPLTEIIQSGQAFSPSIALERILWVIIGFFFICAISTSIIKKIKQSFLFGNKSFLSGIKADKREDKHPKKLTDEGK